MNLPNPLTLTNRERAQIPFQEMPLGEPCVRVTNFDEVPLGYSDEQAQLEAMRCRQCKRTPCITACPVGIDIPGFVKLVAQNQIAEAARVLRAKNFLPGVCGRVCPQDKQCQAVCEVGKKNIPVGIGNLERYVADVERNKGLLEIPFIADPSGRRVAVIGSGPAGLTAAYELAIKGHEVVVFEASHRAGGVLVYGIPRFRLPLRIIDESIRFLKKLGVHFVFNMVIGKVLTLDDLLQREGFDAIMIGTGAGLPNMLTIPGSNANGVYSANEYLSRIYLMDANRFPEYSTPITKGKKIAVIGAGNTAMDVLRTARRLGATSTCYYRRSREEAPARTEELEHAEQEGIIWHWLSNPVEFLVDENNTVKGIRCEKMTLSEPDETGRRKPVSTGEFFEEECDTVIMALGCSVNPIIPSTDREVTTNKWGIITVNQGTCQTSKKGVFAAGDAITGGSTVIQAMGQAKVAAAAIHEYLTAAPIVPPMELMEEQTISASEIGLTI